MYKVSKLKWRNSLKNDQHVKIRLVKPWNIYPVEFVCHLHFAIVFFELNFHPIFTRLSTFATTMASPTLSASRLASAPTSWSASLTGGRPWSTASSSSTATRTQQVNINTFCWNLLNSIVLSSNTLLSGEIFWNHYFHYFAPLALTQYLICNS